MKPCICLIFILATSHAFAEKLVYKTFYFGFHAEKKAEVIKNDLLSEEGKMYSIGGGSYFIRDKESILEEIKNFLDGQAGIQAKTLLIRLRDKNSSSRADFGISGQVKTKPLSGQVELGQQSVQNVDNSTLKVTALNGHAVKITDLRKTEELTIYRNRFMSLYLKEYFLDGFEFEVLPVLSGKDVKVVLKRRYYATINGKRRSFKESTMETTRVVRLGQWSSLAANTRASENSNRSSTGLSFGKSSSQSSFNMDIRVDLEGNTSSARVGEQLVVPKGKDF